MSDAHHSADPPGSAGHPRRLRRVLLAAVAACLAVGAVSFAVGRGSGTAPAAGAKAAPERSAAPCRGGTYTWFGVREEPLLTGVARAARPSEQGPEKNPLVVVARLALLRGRRSGQHRAQAEGTGEVPGREGLTPPRGARRRHSPDLVAVVASTPERPVFGRGCPRPVPWDKAVAGPPGGRTKDETPDSPIREKR
ncbi:hypothetical protein [Streptomyces sp. NPDC058374]|uniref:hypothetical protein n=1 Tax=Streptomyces sp. NPDC058374 TaxID=3346466 RepID=UPI00365CFB37